jgi:hypothetical protein
VSQGAISGVARDCGNCLRVPPFGSVPKMAMAFGGIEGGGWDGRVSHGAMSLLDGAMVGAQSEREYWPGKRKCQSDELCNTSWAPVLRLRKAVMLAIDWQFVSVPILCLLAIDL